MREPCRQQEKHILGKGKNLCQAPGVRTCKESNVAEAERAGVPIVGKVLRCGSDWITEDFGHHLKGFALNCEGDENHGNDRN